jgi:catechol 2,3-dioxygenase-like lactoylglutathione lyase family enzyme
VTTSIGNVAINVSNLQRSILFYTQVIGLAVLAIIETEDVHEVIVGAEGEGSQLMLAQRMGGSLPQPPSGIWKVFVNTDELDAVLERARAAGALVAGEPIFLERFNLELGFVTDPDGYLIELGQRRGL